MKVEVQDFKQSLTASVILFPHLKMLLQMEKQ